MGPDRFGDEGQRAVRRAGEVEGAVGERQDPGVRLHQRDGTADPQRVLTQLAEQMINLEAAR